jgi:hypothetical protein
MRGMNNVCLQQEEWFVIFVECVQDIKFLDHNGRKFRTPKSITFWNVLLVSSTIMWNLNWIYKNLPPCFAPEMEHYRYLKNTSSWYRYLLTNFWQKLIKFYSLVSDKNWNKKLSSGLVNFTSRECSTITSVPVMLCGELQWSKAPSLIRDMAPGVRNYFIYFLATFCFIVTFVATVRQT